MIKGEGTVIIIKTAAWTGNDEQITENGNCRQKVSPYKHLLRCGW